MRTSLAGASCLVLGAGGFLGGHLCHALLAAGAGVRGFGRWPRFPAGMPALRFVAGEFQDTAAIGRGRPTITFRPGRRADVPVNVLDIAQARTALGWEPRTGWMDGLRRTVAWVAEAFPVPAAAGGSKTSSAPR